MDEATELLRSSRSAGFRPDVRAYNMLLKGHASARDLASMQAVVQEMAELQINPSIFTYNILLDAYVNNGDIEEVGGSTPLCLLCFCRCPCPAPSALLASLRSFFM
jgi:hypothetical protein